MKKTIRFLAFVIVVLACLLVLGKYREELTVWWENAEFDIADIAAEALEEAKESVELNSGNYDIDEATMFSEEHPIWEGDMDKRQIVEATELPDALRITVSGCGLSVKESADDSIYIEGSGNYRMQGYVEENTLILSMVSKGELTKNMESAKVVLYLPKDWNYFDASITVGAGSVDVDTLSAATIAAEVGAGSLVMHNANTSDAKLSVGAGNLEYNGSVGQALEATVTAGMLDMSLEGDADDFNYEVNKIAGVIEIGDVVMKDKELSTEINNGASKTAGLQCTIGKIELSFTPM